MLSGAKLEVFFKKIRDPEKIHPGFRSWIPDSEVKCTGF
jgi:hypothetical protein